MHNFRYQNMGNSLVTIQLVAIFLKNISSFAGCLAIKYNRALRSTSFFCDGHHEQIIIYRSELKMFFVCIICQLTFKAFRDLNGLKLYT